jgi:hypothetical protein
MENRTVRLSENIMIDLETLDTTPTAVFPVICAYEFDPITGEKGDFFYRNIDIPDQISCGRTMGYDTILWWMNQSDEARKQITAPGELLFYVLADLRMFIPKNAKVWSNGIDFDLSILRSAYAKATLPWEYWNQRDMRTVVKLAQELCCFDPKSIPFEGTKHNAKADCEHQIRLLSEAFRCMGISSSK